MKRSLTTPILAVFYVFCAAGGTAPAAEGCGNRHTNEVLMNSLHKPPPLPQDTGLG